MRRVLTAERGGSSPQIVSMSSSSVTCVPSCSSRIASVARCCGEPRFSSAPSSHARTGPSSVNRSPALIGPRSSAAQGLRRCQEREDRPCVGRGEVGMLIGVLHCRHECRLRDIRGRHDHNAASPLQEDHRDLVGVRPERPGRPTRAYRQPSRFRWATFGGKLRTYNPIWVNRMCPDLNRVVSRTDVALRREKLDQGRVRGECRSPARETPCTGTGVTPHCGKPGQHLVRGPPGPVSKTITAIYRSRRCEPWLRGARRVRRTGPPPHGEFAEPGRRRTVGFAEPAAAAWLGSSRLMPRSTTWRCRAVRGRGPGARRPSTPATDTPSEDHPGSAVAERDPLRA